MPKKDKMLKGTIFEIIPEESIRAAADVMPNPDNTFVKLLGYGDEFKAAALTPIYIINSKTADVYVTSAERVQKIFH